MTFLREPVDRVLSHYYRHMHRPELSPAERLERRRAGESHALPRSRKRSSSCDRRSSTISPRRFLCGHPSPMGELPPSALDDAKANLREFAFVGIQERFEESIVLLQRALGLEVVPYLNRHVSLEGRRPAVDEIPDEQRALIEDCNRLDAELARRSDEGLFERRARSLPPARTSRLGLDGWPDAATARGSGFADAGVQTTDLGGTSRPAISYLRVRGRGLGTRTAPAADSSPASRFRRTT